MEYATTARCRCGTDCVALTSTDKELSETVPVQIIPIESVMQWARVRAWWTLIQKVPAETFTMDSLLPLISFAFVSSVTPGPNNLLLTSSGMRFGFVRTVPHIVGIQAGLALQLALCATGAGLLLLTVPGITTGVRVVGTSYLLYLAWRLWQSNGARADEGTAPVRPFTVAQAAAFQFINPKAWMMSLTAASLLQPQRESATTSILLLCGIFCLVATPSSGSWALVGSAVRRYLEDPVWRRAFNAFLGCLTAYSALALWFT